MRKISNTRSRQQGYVGRRARVCVTMLCMVIALSGCTAAQGEGQPTPKSVPPTPTGTILPFTTIAQGEQISSSPLIEKPHVIIITKVQEVDSALRQVAGDPPRLTTSPHPVEQARQVDYGRAFAILVLQGRQGSLGYSVTVNQVIHRSDQVQILATFVRLGDQGPAISSASETDPYHLIVIPKTGTWGQDVRFELVDKGKVVAETTHCIL
jgi:hypothetical protein